MQVGGARLTAGERRRRLTNKLRLNCSEAGHMEAVCPVAGQSSSRKGENMVSVTSTRLPSGGRSEFRASVRVGGAAFQVSALIDSGAEGDFMDYGLAKCLGILSILPWPNPSRLGPFVAHYSPRLPVSKMSKNVSH